MKPERAFIAERALARHCPELLPGPQPDAALLALFAAGGERLAQLLPAALAPISGTAGIAANAEPARLCSAADLAGEIGPLAANSLLAAGGQQAPLLVSVEATAILRMVDRAFGGRGDVPAPLPERFPLSAELMIARLETALAAAVGEALFPGWHEALTIVGRGASLAGLAPFAADALLTVQRIALTEPAGTCWYVTLALPLDAIGALLGTDAHPRRPATAAPAPANPADTPYGALPLTLSAVLVDMAMPFAALAALTPGQVLPVSVARAVPLRVGETTIAHGSVGAVDERVAVQITQAF